MSHSVLSIALVVVLCTSLVFFGTPLFRFQNPTTSSRAGTVIMDTPPVSIDDLPIASSRNAATTTASVPLAVSRVVRIPIRSAASLASESPTINGEVAHSRGTNTSPTSHSDVGATAEFVASVATAGGGAGHATSAQDVTSTSTRAASSGNAEVKQKQPRRVIEEDEDEEEEEGNGGAYAKFAATVRSIGESAAARMRDEVGPASRSWERSFLLSIVVHKVYVLALVDLDPPSGSASSSVMSGPKDIYFAGRTMEVFPVTPGDGEEFSVEYIHPSIYPMLLMGSDIIPSAAALVKARTFREVVAEWFALFVRAQWATLDDPTRPILVSQTVALRKQWRWGCFRPVLTSMSILRNDALSSPDLVVSATRIRTLPGKDAIGPSVYLSKAPQRQSFDGVVVLPCRPPSSQLMITFRAVELRAFTGDLAEYLIDSYNKTMAGVADAGGWTPGVDVAFLGIIYGDMNREDAQRFSLACPHGRLMYGAGLNKSLGHSMPVFLNLWESYSDLYKQFLGN